MNDFSVLLQHGASNAWLFVPSAILLGALHGLEPGHSKTMLAAFLVAVRGTLGQAVLLGLSATLSHTAVVHEAVIRLLGNAVFDKSPDRAYLFAASARACGRLTGIGTLNAGGAGCVSRARSITACCCC